jgi:hypothetical protein
MRRPRKISRRFWILLALVLVAFVVTGYVFIFGARICGCTTPLYDATTTALAQTNVSVLTGVADTATASARTLTPTPGPGTSTALYKTGATQTAIAKAQTGTPTP